MLPSSPPPSPGRLRQAAIFLAGLAGKRPPVPASAEALERLARKAMSKEAWAYVAGGAGEGATMAANRRAFARWRLVPRMLRAGGPRRLAVSLFGREQPTPFVLAPIGVLDLAREGGDLHAARAAAAEEVPMVFSSQASEPMERVASAMGGGTRWFQLYWSASDALTRSFVRRAEVCGCSAIVLTLDTTLLGWRPQDLDLAYLPFLHGRGIAQYTSDPVFRRELDDPLPDLGVAQPRVTTKAVRALLGATRRMPLPMREARQAIRRFVATYSRPALSWGDLPRLRAMTTLPIVVKGILDADDARRAIDAGMDGVVVSNHGGRQVDRAIASLDALPRVVEAVGGRIPVLLDSGVRTGADAAIALALGARAVLVGRPYVYGLAVAGEEGVREVLRNLVAELDLTMALCGAADFGELAERLERAE